MFDNVRNGEYNIQKRCWIVAFSKHCTLHSAHFQTSLTCLPLKTGPLSCSAPGPGWVHIPATAGGELVVARRAAGNRKISWNSNQCSNKCTFYCQSCTIWLDVKFSLVSCMKQEGKNTWGQYYHAERHHSAHVLTLKGIFCSENGRLMCY